MKKVREIIIIIIIITIIIFPGNLMIDQVGNIRFGFSNFIS